MLATSPFFHRVSAALGCLPHFPDLQPLGAGIHVRIQCPTAVAGRWTTQGSRSTDGLSAFGEDGVSTLLHIIEIPGTAQTRLKSGRI